MSSLSLSILKYFILGAKCAKIQSNIGMTGSTGIVMLLWQSLTLVRHKIPENKNSHEKETKKKVKTEFLILTEKSGRSSTKKTTSDIKQQHGKKGEARGMLMERATKQRWINAIRIPGRNISFSTPDFKQCLCLHEKLLNRKFFNKKKSDKLAASLWTWATL